MPRIALRPTLILTLLLAAPAAWGQPGNQPVPTTLPTREPPRLAIVDFASPTDGDPRDAWMTTAFEELLSRRLRRVPGLTVIPTVRLYQARRELQQPGQPLPPWPDVVNALGATHILLGQCSGSGKNIQLHVTLVHRNTNFPATDNGKARPGRFFELLDIVTRWTIEQIGLPEPEPAVQTQLYAPPASSLNAVEYHARALAAWRNDDPRNARRYAGEALSADNQFAPALALLGHLEMPAGASGLTAAYRRFQLLSHLARRNADSLDQSNAELGLSMILRAEGHLDAAKARADTALKLARASDDLYAEIAALSWLSDLSIAWPIPADADPAQRKEQLRQHLEQAAALEQTVFDKLRSVRDNVGALTVVSKLALINERLDRAPAAHDLHKEALRLAMLLNSRRHQATAWLFLGQCYRNQEQWPRAIAALTSCLEFADPKAQPQVRVALASVYQSMQEPAKALEQFETALSKLRQQEPPDLGQQFVCLREIAQLRHQSGNAAAAITALQEAVDLAHVLELPQHGDLAAQLAAWRTETP
jgi:tetratricopeptide (TPR) repeat protein/TolB-like protein